MSNVISLIVLVVSALAGLGAAAAFLAAGNQKGRILKLEADATDLRNDIADRDRRIEFLETANSRIEALSKAKGIEMLALHQQMDVLGQVIRGEAEFAALRDHLDLLHEHFDGAFTAVNTRFTVLDTNHSMTHAILERIERAIIIKEQA